MTPTETTEPQKAKTADQPSYSLVMAGVLSTNPKVLRGEITGAQNDALSPPSATHIADAAVRFGVRYCTPDANGPTPRRGRRTACPAGS